MGQGGGPDPKKSVLTDAEREANLLVNPINSGGKDYTDHQTRQLYQKCAERSGGERCDRRRVGIAGSARRGLTWSRTRPVADAADVHSRLHALTKADNVGLGCLIVGLAFLVPFFVRVSLLVGLYLLALEKHAERDRLRRAEVDLTAGRHPFTLEMFKNREGRPASFTLFAEGPGVRRQALHEAAREWGAFAHCHNDFEGLQALDEGVLIVGAELEPTNGLEERRDAGEHEDARQGRERRFPRRPGLAPAVERRRGRRLRRGAEGRGDSVRGRAAPPLQSASTPLITPRDEPPGSTLRACRGGSLTS